jgi:hypothetical protein
VSDTGQAASSPALGAYGLRLSGLDAAADLLVPVSATAPEYAVEAEVGRPPEAPEFVDDDRAELALRSGGRVLLDRNERRARFVVPHAVRPDELVHPYLAPAAAVIGRWYGRESMHAGAFAVDGRAWGVVGTRGAGKSSTLAWLALAGTDVLCDDMLVLDARTPFRGPRSIDLRQDAARRFDAGEAIGVTGARERWRLRLAPGAAAHSLAGWLLMEWGDRIEVRSLGAGERLKRLVPQRAVRLPPARAEAVLELASLPAFEVSRPRGWASLPETGERLLELASATPAAGA